MSLSRRIVNLEAVHSAALNACRTCGGHDPRNYGYVVTRDDRPLAHCVECGLALTEDGKPLPPNYKRVILRDLDAV